jgi:hypothetical protein
MSARRHRPFGRKEPEKHRDARLFVVATEDTYAARQYFGLFGGMSPRVKIVVSETTDNRSSPGHVVDRLLRYRDVEELNEDDRLWALIDTDHWVESNHKPQLLEALKRAKESGITVAMSNPCFDLWLLLHHMDLPEDHGIVDGKGVADYMRRNGVPFNKLRLDLGCYGPEAVRLAIERSRRLVVGSPPTGRPQAAGTHVHHLLLELCEAGIVLG